MVIFAVVPVKNLEASKRRLSTVFNPRQRKELTIAMLEDVLRALKSSTVNETVVVGEDEEVRNTAQKLNASYIASTHSGLNPAIEEASSYSLTKNASSILILPADIPLLNSKEINRILELGQGNSAVVLSPSHNWGTNALYENPPKQIPTCFGPKSFLKHIKEAYLKGVSVRLYFSPGTSIDIDSARDLRKLLQIENTTICKQVLEQIISQNQRAREYLQPKKKTNK